MSASEVLLERWMELICRLSLRGDVARAGRDLLARYAQPHRRYHGCDHLADCLRVLDLHAVQAFDPPAVEAALWFHDAVYEVGAKDNERRSADLAAQVLGGLGLTGSRLIFVSSAILATRHADEPAPGDEQLVCDIDLSILGAPPERYDAYAAAILAESGLSLEVFRPLRLAFLQSMLARDHIFHTAPFRHTYELQARQNMCREMEELEREE